MATQLNCVAIHNLLSCNFYEFDIAGRSIYIATSGIRPIFFVCEDKTGDFTDVADWCGISTKSYKTIYNAVFNFYPGRGGICQLPLAVHPKTVYDDKGFICFSERSRRIRT